MKKLKVMHVLCMSTFSGAENVAITIINTLKDEIDGIYVSPDGVIADIVRENGIVHYPVDKVSVACIRKALRDIQPDIIHAHDFRAAIICSFATGRVPIVNHLHNNCPWMRSMGLKSIIYAATSARYRKILTVSDSVMEEYVFGRRFKNKTIVIGNPVNISQIIEKARDMSVDYDEQIKKVDIVFLGRLTMQKNPIFFLEIIKSIKSRKEDLKVSMIGEGELRNEVECKIKEYGLDNCIVLHGFQKNPYPYVKAAKVMCMPSLWEGFGLAAVEALALGKPVLAAPVGGLVGIVNESCGKLCTEREEYVAEALKLLCDRQEYESKSSAAVARAGELDNINEYRKMILKCYRQVSCKK